jgi:hypothetical protein
VSKYRFGLDEEIKAEARALAALVANGAVVNRVSIIRAAVDGDFLFTTLVVTFVEPKKTDKGEP